MFFGKNVGWSSEDTAYQIISVVAMTGFSVKILFTKYTVRELFIASSALLLSVLVFFFSGKIAIVFTVLTIIGAKNVKIENWINSIFYTQLAIIIFNLILALTGEKGSEPIVHTRVYFGKELNVRRMALGFEHPNSLHFAIFVVISILIYKNYKHYTMTHYFVLFIGNLGTYFLTQSRTGFLVVCTLLLLSMVMNIIDLAKFKYIFLFIPLLFSFLNIILSYLFTYNSSLMVSIDNLVQGRLNYSHYFLTNYPLSLFGNNIIFDTWHIIDSSYIELFVSYGLLIYGLFVVVYMLLINKAINENNKRVLLIVIAFLIYGNMEVFLPNIFKNFSLIFISPLLFEHKKEIF